jgi:hypothetical protein
MRRSLRTTLVALAAASLLALLEIFRTNMTRVLEGHPLPPHELLHRVLPLWGTIVLASPWCAFMAWRFPFRGGRTLRTLAAHVGGSAVFVALHVGLLLGIHALIALAVGGRVVFLHEGGWIRESPWRAPELAHLYFFYVGMEMSVYAAIVIVLLLLEARREAAERAIASERLERSLTAARLEGLQAQLRPHFLFNTLNALAVLARRGDGAAVDHAIGDLGELLRASFDTTGRHEIPLGEELQFLERYVNLQRIRFPGRLEFECEAADDVRRALVPALLVQPLVENALEHGLDTARGGRVRVAARRDGGTLEIEVTDDGRGFGGAPGERAGGVGLANTRERLALLHGEAGALECADRPGGGGLVRIRIPWRTRDAAGDRA